MVQDGHVVIVNDLVELVGFFNDQGLELWEVVLLLITVDFIGDGLVLDFDLHVEDWLIL